MRFYALALGILCTWRLTYLLYAEDGPRNMIVRLRGWAREELGTRVVDCFYCLSLWIAVPFAALLGETLLESGLLWLSCSAGAILLERITDRGAGAPPAAYVEEEMEDQDVVLR